MIRKCLPIQIFFYFLGLLVFTIDIHFVDFKFEVGDLATWVGGLGTIATLIFAFWQLHSDRRTARDNEKISQATKVSVWIDSENSTETCYSIQNVSDSPIYQAVITLVAIQGSGLPQNGEDNESYGYRVALATVPPGKYYAISPSGGGGMHLVSGAEIAFTDAEGNYWVRRSNGQLKEIDKNPLEFYHIDSPVSWRKVRNEKPWDWVDFKI